jgi:hypothetical protein
MVVSVGPRSAPREEPVTVEEPESAQKQEEKAPPQAREPTAPRRARNAAVTPRATLQTARANETGAGPKEREAAPAPKEAEVAAAVPASPREATLNIVALPWAEVFVDGTRHGVSPPCDRYLSGRANIG